MAVDLWCANEAIRVDDSIAEMSRPRVHVAAFTLEPSGTSSFAIERVRGLEGQRLQTALGDATVKLEPHRLLVDIEDGDFAGELALRLGYYVLITRRGGALVHATALAHNARALVACGKSGDGKSTLARLSSKNTTLLTDEIVALFPDGRVAGTPFRSDFDNVGAPGMYPAAYFVALRKAEHEAFEPLDAMQALSLVAEQAFEPEVFSVPRVEIRKRLMQFMSTVKLSRLAFRKDEAVGPFVARALE